MKQKLEILQNMLSSVSKFYIESKKVESERWERGESFNIFNTIGLKSEEVRLHSAFIGELLNPKGSHGASSLFLKAFLDVMQIEDGTHAVIIENKIYASDQCNQLLRYHNYGDWKFPAGYKFLVYLRPF